MNSATAEAKCAYRAVRSALSRGDLVRPESCPRCGKPDSGAKLSEADVRNIRMLNKYGVSQRQLAVLYEVVVSTIVFITRRETWTHVDKALEEQ